VSWLLVTLRGCLRYAFCTLPVAFHAVTLTSAGSYNLPLPLAVVASPGTPYCAVPPPGLSGGHCALLKPPLHSRKPSTCPFLGEQPSSVPCPLPPAHPPPTHNRKDLMQPIRPPPPTWYPLLCSAAPRSVRRALGSTAVLDPCRARPAVVAGKRQRWATWCVWVWVCVGGGGEKGRGQGGSRSRPKGQQQTGHCCGSSCWVSCVGCCCCQCCFTSSPHPSLPSTSPWLRATGWKQCKQSGTHP
jgi:hypothetical protein